MAHHLNLIRTMRIATFATALLLFFTLSGCRGERTPRDYQNAPPAMTHPATSSGQTPSANGMRGAAPEPSQGAEGINVTRQPATGTQPAEKLKNQAPTTTSPPHL
jgi:hypothetical protein